MLATNGTEKSENSFVQTGNRNGIVRGDLAQVTPLQRRKKMQRFRVEKGPVRDVKDTY